MMQYLCQIDVVFVPDHTTYGIFLQGCTQLLPKDERRKWSVVETVFNRVGVGKSNKGPT